MKLVLTINRARHLEKCGILPDEVDQVNQDPAHITMNMRGGGRFLLGRTAAGRYLKIALRPGPGGWHIWTGWPMSEREKRFFKAHNKRRRLDET